MVRVALREERDDNLQERRVPLEALADKRLASLRFQIRTQLPIEAKGRRPRKRNESIVEGAAIEAVCG